MRRSSRRLATVGIAIAVVTACSGKDPYNPGDPIGAFHVTGALMTTSCGATPNPWEFDVKLRHDATTLYWVQGGAPIQGTVDATAHATLTSQTTSTLRDADAQKRIAACVVTRTDSLDLALDVGGVAATSTNIAEATAFTATLRYHFEPSSDSYCADQVTASGGDFDALPCEVAYTLGGKRTGDLK
jgi:hypothetical protein